MKPAFASSTIIDTFAAKGGRIAITLSYEEHS
jgi:hypothetical protein